MWSSLGNLTTTVATTVVFPKEFNDEYVMSDDVVNRCRRGHCAVLLHNVRQDLLPRGLRHVHSPATEWIQACVSALFMALPLHSWH